jgi:hypothetical protein
MAANCATPPDDLTAHGPVRRAAVNEGRSTAGQALRRFTLGSGPLKRSSDRLEFFARVLLVCSLVTAIPIAMVVASVAHAQALTDATAQAIERTQVDAELVADPPHLTTFADDVPQTSRGPAVWRGPSGAVHSGLIVVPIGAKAGATVPIWVDRDGALTTRPLDSKDAVTGAVGMAAGTYLIVSSLAVGVYLALRSALDRSRLRRWAADWEVIEPVWTRTVY